MKYTPLQYARFWRYAWIRFRDEDNMKLPPTKEQWRKRRERKEDRLQIAEKRFSAEMQNFRDSFKK